MSASWPTHVVKRQKRAKEERSRKRFRRLRRRYERNGKRVMVHAERFTQSR